MFVDVVEILTYADTGASRTRCSLQSVFVEEKSREDVECLTRFIQIYLDRKFTVD